MRIRSVELEGLWAYRERQHLNLDGLPLVVGVGENGAGKSAIIVHSVVAAFFAKFPTKTQAESVTDGASAGHVSVEFEHAGAVYRIGRVFPRSGVGQGALEVQDDTSKSGWRPLTEKGNREVTDEVVKLIGMDYATATMTWIAEQGQYGKFATAEPRDRFKLLSGIFGLGDYEDKKRLAAEKVDAAGKRIDIIDGRLQELEHAQTLTASGPEEHAERSDEDIDTALTAENTRLDQVNTEMADLNSGDPERRVREAQAALDVVRSKRTGLLEETQRDVARIVRTRQEAEDRQNSAVAHADARLTSALGLVDERASASRTSAERQKLQAEQALTAIAESERGLGAAKFTVKVQRDAAADHRARAEQLTRQINEHTQTRATLLADWATLKDQHQAVSKRLETLTTSLEAEHAECFTCNQHLSADDAKALIDLSNAELARIEARQDEVKPAGAAAGAAVNAAAAERDQEMKEAEQADRAAEQASAAVTRMETVIATKTERSTAFREADMMLLNLDTEAEQEKAAAHDARDTEVKTLVKAYENEVKNLAAQQKAAEEKVATLLVVPTAEEDLAGALDASRQAVAAEVEQVNEARQGLENRRIEIRAAINVLLAERTRRVEVANQRRELIARIALLSKDRDKAAVEQGTYKTLVKAFSSTGIPAMVLAGMMEQLNDSINVSLERLSRGQMQVRLAASKDGAKNTTDNKITVYVETPQGTRAYEALSGGQKFRVDLAIRTGLAEAITRGTGAPIEAFILDEGWGSLDEKGIISTVETLFRLSETTNVLTVSHIAAVRDAFPNRVEVEMVGGTSVARVS